MGRLVRDPELRYSQAENPVAVVRYTIAVDRQRKKEGSQNTDFINCVAFGKAGEFANEYFHIENIMLFQLDEQKCSMIPDYLIEQCDVLVDCFRSIVKQP